MNQPDHIKILANSVSTYIDNYEGATLNSEESKAVLKAREIIVESLEFLKSGTHKEKASSKVLSRLDASFTDVIDIFTKGSFPSPEILETIKKREEKDQEPALKSPSTKKKPKKTKKTPTLEKEESKRLVSSKQMEKDMLSDLIKLLGVMKSDIDVLKIDNKKMKKLMAAAFEAMAELTTEINTLKGKQKVNFKS